MVCGIIGPGTSRTLASKWDSPLEQTNVGSNIKETTSGTVQALTGNTMITTFSSTQVWQGNMPIKFSLNLILFAQTDAYREVMLPLQWLEEFASPNLKAMMPIDVSSQVERAKAFMEMAVDQKSNDNLFGRVPQPITINIGRRIIMPMCVIENITIPLDKEVTSSGDLIRAEVQLDIQTLVMQNRDKIAGSWTGGYQGNKALYEQ